MAIRMQINELKLFGPFIAGQDRHGGLIISKI